MVSESRDSLPRGLDELSHESIEIANAFTEIEKHHRLLNFILSLIENQGLSPEVALNHLLTYLDLHQAQVECELDFMRVSVKRIRRLVGHSPE